VFIYLAYQTEESSEIHNPEYITFDVYEYPAAPVAHVTTSITMN